MSSLFDPQLMKPIGFLETCPVFPGLGPRSPIIDPELSSNYVEKLRDARIVIVDDDESVANIVRSILVKTGYRSVQIVKDSSEAMDRITDSIPDVVILDIHMQPVDGWQILESLRRDDRTQHIPTLVMTSATDDDTRIRSYSMGAIDFIGKPIAPTELLVRIRNTLSSKLYRDLMTQYSLQLESDVLRDGLTGIANRRAFDYELKRRLVDWNRQQIPLSLMMIDIDHFKQLNDRYGHQVGDQCLQVVARLLGQSTREMDLVSRFGGEEFAIILPHSTSQDSKAAVERTRMLIAEHIFHVNQNSFSITASMGIADVMHGDDAELMIRRADAALYKAKRSGRNCSYFHNGANCEPVSIPTESVASSPVPVHGDHEKTNAAIENKKIAIIDDEAHIIAITRKYLRDAGYQRIVATSNASEAIHLIRSEVPDLILMDLRMPNLDGLEILRQIRLDEQLKNTPVLIFTSATDKDTKVKALQAGASDYCEKPVHSGELLVRVRNTLMAKSHVDFLADYSSNLEHEVELRTAELEVSRREAIQCLARAAEMRDDNTGKHILRVGRYAAIIAQELGFGDERVLWLEHAAQLHDVGKIGVPDSVLLKPGPLTQDEFRVMQKHCLGGSRIIRNDSDIGSGESRPISDVIQRNQLNSPLMQMAAVVAETHHERWDGTGYPRNLQGEEIPIEGRITAVADVFDALSTPRPYKKAIPLDQCFTIMFENRGSHFDPAVLDAFFRCKSEIVRTYHDYRDTTVDETIPDELPTPCKQDSQLQTAK